MRVKMPTTKGGGRIRLALAVQLLATFVGLVLYGYVELTPPTRVATTGRPVANASPTAFGKPSFEVVG